MAETPYVTIRSRRPVGGLQSNFPSGSAPKPATHDISRTSYHVKDISHFASALEESATRAFPNRGRSSQRYKKVHALLLHWSTDDLFVLPELEDMEKCLREDYAFETEIFPIPADNAHLELMMRMGQLIKEHESQDTLFLVYYGGHARIDEARQSRWCATRNPDSPWLQWSAIQTLLERSVSDILILLDCCAGAASATFSSGNSTTETISASSWDAIAPDPGRYSFTNALIEVLQEWHHRTFSAAMLHAEVLARLKHPRPILINGKYFEARSTPVHFMMTSDHKAPSIEIARTRSCESPLPPQPREPSSGLSARRAASPVYDPVFADSASDDTAMGTPDSDSAIPPGALAGPNEDNPHVMISLALEDDQSLDLNAWESWLASFPALAKFVKVQGVFKSHSTLLLLSLPVMIWDLLPENLATSFVAFVRSNNLAIEKSRQQRPVEAKFAPNIRNEARNVTRPESFRPESFISDGLTMTPSDATSIRDFIPAVQHTSAMRIDRPFTRPGIPTISSSGNADISRALIYNQHRSGRRTTFGDKVPDPPNFAKHIEHRLEYYHQRDAHPSDADREFIASNLGIEAVHVEAWYHYRRERDVVRRQLGTLKLGDRPREAAPRGPRMILPGHLNELLDLSLPGQVVLVDLRTPADFERSHIRGAANLRAPVTFLRQAPFEMIEAAFADYQSRRAFSTWQTARCIVFYSRALESPWECPAAETLSERFAAEGWDGEVYLLKGHYREFSASFGRHVGGAGISREGREHAEALRRRSVSKEDVARSEDEYRAWRRAGEAEDLGAGGQPPPADGERREALARHEEELERALREKFPEFYGAAGRHGDAGQRGRPGHGKDDFGDAKAQMVGYLDRGLTRMREASGKAPPGDDALEWQERERQRAPGHEKVVEYLDDGGGRSSSGEYVEVSRGDMREEVDGEQAKRGGRAGGGLFNRVMRRA